jgi:cytochrome c biogenesis protein CcmG, thiol:disulfide interchange protein DsbE
MDATQTGASSNAGRSAWRWVPVLALAAVVLVYLAWSRGRRAGSGTEGPAIGRTLPYLRLEPLTGSTTPVTLDDLKGRVTVVNYWGTWCPPCRREFPHIVELAARFGARDDFRLYAVSCGSDSENFETLRSETQAFLATSKAALPTWWDENAASRRALGAVLDGEGFGGYPTTLVLDRQGTIRGMWVGYTPGNERDMEAVVGQLLR